MELYLRISDKHCSLNDLLSCPECRAPRWICSIESTEAGFDKIEMECLPCRAYFIVVVDFRPQRELLARRRELIRGKAGLEVPGRIELPCARFAGGPVANPARHH